MELMGPMKPPESMEPLEPIFQEAIATALRQRQIARNQIPGAGFADPRRLVILDLASAWPGRNGPRAAALASTVLAWIRRNHGWAGVRLQYVLLTREPLSVARTALLSALEAAGLECVADLNRLWPPDTPGVHRVALDTLGITLILGVGEPLALLARLSLVADWTLLGPDAALVRAGAARVMAQGLAWIPPAPGEAVMRAPGSRNSGQAYWLERAGFTRPGGACGSWWLRQHGGRFQPAPQAGGAGGRRALVIGAGLAGCALSHRLGQGGWAVTLLEAESAVASGASGQPVLAEHPSVTPDDALLSRLTRRALLDARAGYDAGITRRTGRLQQVPQGSTVLDRMAHWPRDWVEVLDAREAGLRLGWPLKRGGLWLPMAGHADPQALCQVWAGAATERVFGKRVARLQKSSGGSAAWARPDGAGNWQALAADGQLISEAPVVIVCGAGQSLQLLGEPTEGASGASGAGHAPGVSGSVGVAGMAGILGIKGKVPGWPPPLELQSGRSARFKLPFPGPAGVLGSPGGYLIPLGADECLMGPHLDGIDDAAGPQGLGQWLAQPAAAATAGCTTQLLSVHCGSRVSTLDHLPLIGPVPDVQATSRQYESLVRNDRLSLPVMDGLWIASALGGRGLLWAVLAAELLATRLEGEPAAFEDDLVAAVDPARFIRRILRSAVRGQ